jgi:dephospho-CoA kinase
MIKQKIIGLTGGISTGKTTVADYLATQYHLSILDADLYAREAVIKDSPVWTKIVTRYGQEILLEDQEINRHKLGEIIFHDPEEKAWLEAQIHPFVRDCLIREINHLEDHIIVLVIPLLFEANMVDLVTEVWVVICHHEQQIQRLMKRNNLSLEEAEIRINNQWSLEEKKAQADLVLDNSSSSKFLYQQIDQYLLNQYDEELMSFNYLEHNLEDNLEQTPVTFYLESSADHQSLTNILLEPVMSTTEIKKIQDFKDVISIAKQESDIIFIDQSSEPNPKYQNQLNWIDL